MTEKIDLKNIQLENLQTPEQFTEVAKILTEESERIIQEEKTSAQKLKKEGIEKAKRLKEREAIQVKINTVKEHLGKTQEGLDNLYAEKKEYLGNMSKQLPTSEILEADIKPTAMLERVYKAPIEEYKQSLQVAGNIEKLELHKANLEQMLMSLTQEQNNLVRQESDRERNQAKLERAAATADMKDSLIESIQDFARTYLRSENLFANIKNLASELNILDSSAWYDQTVKDKSVIQILGGPLRRGSVDVLTLNDFISYASEQGLFKDRGTEQFYERTNALKGINQDFDKSMPAEARFDEPTAEAALDKALETPTIDEAPTAGGDSNYIGVASVP